MNASLLKHLLPPLLLLAALIALLSNMDLGKIGAVDLIQYWSSARLLIQGENPYDKELLTALQMQIHGGQWEIIRIWNPPLIFLFSIPLAVLPFHVAVAFWMIASSLLMVVSISLIQRRLTPIQKIWMMTFFPFAVSFYYGQCSPLLLFGLALSIYFDRRDSKRDRYLSGAALSITLLKPHLLYLLYIVLIYRGVRGEREKLSGFILGGILLAVVPLIFNPAVYSLYAAVLSEPPIYFKNPTLGTWLQAATGVHSIWIRTLPSILTALSYIWLLFSGRVGNGNLSDLTALSILTSPYAWLYDQMLSVPLVLAILQRVKPDNGAKGNMVVALLIAANLALLLFTGRGQELCVWYPILIVLVRYGFK